MRLDWSRSILSMRAELGRWLPSLIGMALIAPVCAADTYPRQTGIDALHYTFRLTFRDETDEIDGQARVDLRFLKDGAKEFLLDLASPVSGKGMTVSRVTRGGAERHSSTRMIGSGSFWIRRRRRTSGTRSR